LKIVFMGTPDFALTALQKLYKKHEIICVYTRAPKEAGRGQKLVKSPVHIFAEEHGIEVRTPKTLRNEEEQQKFVALNADISVVAAYGLILPKPVIEAFPYKCVNIHASLLPRWRGAAPIQRAIEAGDKEAGITIMQIVEALDAGDMYLQKSTQIDENTTGGILHDKLAEIGGDLILEYLDNIENIKPTAQNESQVCYAAKIEKEEGNLDFSMPAEVLERKIRAFTPFPSAYFEHKGERFKVLAAKVCDLSDIAGKFIQGKDKLFIACGQGALEIKQIQRQGKKAMQIADFLRGYSFI